MNQEKTGEFLKKLRKEKNLTQEQLAEQFQVSGRSVSRWETGRNMPDLSILVELAEFYEVDIREIIDGERKSESMDKELKESVLKVAEYADYEKNVLVKKMRLVSIIGMCGILAVLLMESFGAPQGVPVFDFLRGAGGSSAFGALFVMILYTSGILGKVKGAKEEVPKALFAVALVLVFVAFVASIIASF